MKWDDLQESANIEDRRGEDGPMVAGGPGFGGGGLGLGTMVILGLVGWAMGINPAILIGGAEMLNNMRGGGQVARHQQERPSAQPGEINDQMGRFVSKVVGSNEAVWSRILPEQKGIRFQAPRLVLFDGATNSACAARNRRWARSIARSTARSISTRLSSAR